MLPLSPSSFFHRYYLVSLVEEMSQDDHGSMRSSLQFTLTVVSRREAGLQRDAHETNVFAERCPRDKRRDFAHFTWL